MSAKKKIEADDPYPGWDIELHKRMIGKQRLVGPGGHIFPADLYAEEWTDPRFERQVCHGTDVNNNPVWKFMQAKPLAGFVSLQARDYEESDYDDAPIPYDYEVPPHASASTIDISNFDKGNPVGVASRDPVAEGDPDGTSFDEAMAKFEATKPSDSDKPAVR